MKKEGPDVWVVGCVSAYLYYLCMKKGPDVWVIGCVSAYLYYLCMKKEEPDVWVIGVCVSLPVLPV